jgi:hypothetical protein
MSTSKGKGKKQIDQKGKKRAPVEIISSDDEYKDEVQAMSNDGDSEGKDMMSTSKSKGKKQTNQKGKKRAHVEIISSDDEYKDEAQAVSSDDDSEGKDVDVFAYTQSTQRAIADELQDSLLEQIQIAAEHEGEDLNKKEGLDKLCDNTASSEVKSEIVDVLWPQVLKHYDLVTIHKMLNWFHAAILHFCPYYFVPSETEKYQFDKRVLHLDTGEKWASRSCVPALAEVDSFPLMREVLELSDGEETIRISLHHAKFLGCCASSRNLRTVASE